MGNTIMYLEQQLKIFGIDLSKQAIAICLGVVVFLILLAIALIAFRGIRLKYWKIDRQIDVLESIEKHLREITPAITNGLKLVEKDNLNMKTQTLKGNINEPATGSLQISMNKNHIADADEIELGDIKLEVERTTKKEEFRKGFLETYNVGNKGEIYIEEELIELIKY